MSSLMAGAAAVDITPQKSQFLFGYPHVRRFSQGVHDPLFCSALFLSDDPTQLLFLATDIIFISKKIARQVRQRIKEKTGISEKNIMISATHTHSGPITVNYISNAEDAAVPKADETYLSYMQERMIQSAEQAVQNASRAKIGLGLADSTGIGTNRRDPAGPADHQVPVLMVKSIKKERNIACMLVCSMHPTILHEDSLLVSADFPGMTRQYLQKNLLGERCPVLHHTGPAGNLSPRHVAQSNTFAEAERLGAVLGQSVLQTIQGISFRTDVALNSVQSEIALPCKTFPSVAAAETGLIQAIEKLQYLKNTGADRHEIRTAECDWFGAEETLSLAKSVKDGKWTQAVQSCLPAEIQIFNIGPWTYVAWPGELFVEYALQIKKIFDNTFIISLANGELQGYIVTAEAAAAGGYEAANALFSHVSGQLLVDETAILLRKSRA